MNDYWCNKIKTNPLDKAENFCDFACAAVLPSDHRTGPKAVAVWQIPSPQLLPIIRFCLWSFFMCHSCRGHESDDQRHVSFPLSTQQRTRLTDKFASGYCSTHLLVSLVLVSKITLDSWEDEKNKQLNDNDYASIVHNIQSNRFVLLASLNIANWFIFYGVDFSENSPWHKARLRRGDPEEKHGRNGDGLWPKWI